MVPEIYVSIKGEREVSSQAMKFSENYLHYKYRCLLQHICLLKKACCKNIKVYLKINVVKMSTYEK